jgi:hypothetical protein
MRMLSKFVSWCRELNVLLTVNASSFRIQVPIISELRKIENLTTVVTDSDIIIIGNYTPPPQSPPNQSELR